MEIVFCLLLILFVVLPQQIDNKLSNLEWRAHFASLDAKPLDMKVQTDLIIADMFGVSASCLRGNLYNCVKPSLRDMHYPIGSQETLFLDATVILRFFIFNMEDEWLIIEAEPKGADWLLFGCHKSSGELGPKHDWQWECVTLSSLDKLHDLARKKVQHTLARDSSVVPGEKTLRDYIRPPENRNRKNKSRKRKRAASLFKKHINTQK